MKVMNFLLVIASLIGSVGYVSHSQAAGVFVESGVISTISITSDDLFFTVTPSSTIDRGVVRNPDSCLYHRPQDYVFLKSDHPRFDEIYRALLVARASRLPIFIWVDGCHTRWEQDFPVVATIRIID